MRARRSSPASGAPTVHHSPSNREGPPRGERLSPEHGRAGRDGQVGRNGHGDRRKWRVEESLRAQRHQAAYRMHMRVDVVAFTAMVSPKLDNVLGEVLCAEDAGAPSDGRSTMLAPAVRRPSLRRATVCRGQQSGLQGNSLDADRLSPAEREDAGRARRSLLDRGGTPHPLICRELARPTGVRTSPRGPGEPACRRPRSK